MPSKPSGSRGRSALSERFRALASAAPDHPAMIDGASGRVTTRSSLVARADALRQQLEARGISSGMRVGIQLPNSVDFVAAFLAAVELECTTVPIDRDARDSEVRPILDQFGINALISRAEASDDLPSLTIRTVIPPAGWSGIALIKLTSGSTGMPRGIMTTAENLIADCTNICETMKIGPADRNLGAIPFSHSYGFSNLVTPLLLEGTMIVISNDYLPHSILNLSNAFECTVLPGIPMIFEHLSTLPPEDGAFETVTKFISAGAPLSPGVSRRFRERFGQQIHSFYGCSECGGIAYDRDGGAVERSRVGSAMANVTLSIDPETDRLIVESGAVARGYSDGEDETLRFRANRFLTDDLAKLDEALELELVGRVGDLINTAGRKVNPREVETVILQMEGVGQARVFGEQAGARGEVVAAVVVADPDVTREQVRAFCAARLSSHKVPRIVKFIDAIPLDERGKFKRAALTRVESTR